MADIDGYLVETPDASFGSGFPGVDVDGYLIDFAPLPVALGAVARTLLVRPAPSLLGIDAACIYDTDAAFSLVAGNANLGRALARRLITPRGGLWYDPDYGGDLRRYLNADVSSAEVAMLPALVEVECEKDPRVQSCEATVAYDRRRERVDLKVRGRSAVGPFEFVFSVTRFSTAVGLALLGETVGSID